MNQKLHKLHESFNKHAKATELRVPWCGERVRINICSCGIMLGSEKLADGNVIWDDTIKEDFVARVLQHTSRSKHHQAIRSYLYKHCRGASIKADRLSPTEVRCYERGWMASKEAYAG